MVARRMTKVLLLCAAVMGLTTLLPDVGHARGKRKQFKIATLAPKGSTWYKVLKAGDRRLRKLSGGKMSFKIYPGGVAGDEADIVRKMRINQLQGAALTSVGLAEIQPDLLVLQAPGLFNNWSELDHVRNRLKDEFRKLLADKGFYPLAWGDVGFNRIFSDQPVRVPAELAQTKPWCWTQDGMYRAYFDAIDAKPVMLGVPEVLPGLQTGLINSFATAPLASLALQWYTRANYMLDLRVGVTIGAAVITQAAVDKLSDEERGWLEQVGKELGEQLKSLVRSGNDDAIAAMKKAGLKLTAVGPEETKAWQTVAVKTRKQAAGKVYPVALLAEVEGALKEYRSSGGQ